MNRASPAAFGIAADMMRETSAEGRLNLLTRNFAPLNELSGSEFVIGETVEQRGQVDGMMGITLNQTITLRAERVENGRLFVSTRGSIPAEDLRRATLTLMERMPVTGEGLNTRAQRDRAIVEVRAASLERSFEGSYEIALDSGLPHRVTTRDWTVSTIGGRTGRSSDALVLERID